MNSRVLFSAAAVVVVVGAAVYAFSSSSRDAGTVAVTGVGPASKVEERAIPPIQPAAEPTEEKPRAEAKSVPAAPVPHPSLPGTMIEPGTPPQFLRPYLDGYIPVMIKKDGTQVYRNIPQLHVKQPDGSFKTQMVDVEVKPTAPLPLDPELEKSGG